MKKITLLLFTLLALLTSNQVDAQCTDFSVLSGPYNDFNSTFGGAPCDDGSGCPLNEMSSFEVWADESYIMDNFVLGNTYSFSICNGPNAGSWTPSFTVIAPSGAVDAFGRDITSDCSITWTASENGTYVIVIAEEGVACGASSNGSVNNGYPAITCATGSTCFECTETAPPACSAVIAPANNATNVATTESTADGTREVAFSWEPVDGAVGYEISFDGVVLGETANSSVNIYGLDYDTTYTWSIAPINCFGTATGCDTWTFTTESTMSVNDNKLESFSVYPNPTTDVLNIKSTQDIDNVTVFNLLGQSVASFSKNEITNSSVNLSDLSEGLYLVEITSGDKTQTIKVTKE